MQRARFSTTFTTMAQAFVPALLLAAGLLACSASSSNAGCVSAFRNVDPRALPPYGASPLDDAVRTCTSTAQWREAWDAVPSAHEGRTDAMSFLASRCALPVLAPTAICRELAGSTGT